MSYVSSYLYCCIRSEGVLYDAECDLLAIAKFVVMFADYKKMLSF